MLAAPNNVLGIAYLKALWRHRSPIVPQTLRRLGAGYNDLEAAGEIASASGIRHLLSTGEPVLRYLPGPVQLPFLRALNRGAHLDVGNLHRLLLARILRGPESLQGLYLVEDGVETRLFEAALASGSYEELVVAGKARHATRTRLQRMLAHVLNETSSSEMEDFLAAGPLYLHLLGASRRGRRFLAACRKSLALPLVGNFSRVQAILKHRYGAGSENCRLAERMLACELRATRNHTLLLREWGGNRNRDYFEEIRSVGA